MIYLNAGEKQRAIDDLEKALKARPQPPKYFHLAQAYLQAQREREGPQGPGGRQDPGFARRPPSPGAGRLQAGDR